MKILFVDNRPTYFASHRLSLAQAASQRGFEVHVTALTRGDATLIRGAGVPFHSISDWKRSNNLFLEGLLFSRLVRLLRRLRPDLLHLITLRGVLYGGLANRIAGVPRVVHSITGLGFLYASEKRSTAALRSLVELGLRPAMSHSPRRVIFQNEDDLALFRGKGLVGEDEGVVIPGSGVDTDRFRPRERSEDEERDPLPLVICPTRILWHKGVDDFVKAARMLLSEGCDATFALVGASDPDNPSAVPPRQIEEWVGTEGLAWWGYREDMPEVYRRCAVVCFPSRYREGVPKVLLEAAASGRPSVTTDMPGCRDAVEDGRTGFVVPPGKPAALADALRRLLQDAGLRREMGARAREHAVQWHSVGRIVDMTISEYSALDNRV